ncbi:MAG: LCP family protein [Oscillospiraceae bacterium]|jgi:LCP family protein required for cell wall assembly|nr:LCP family protein [Oscillospiraceae bacterium]
MAKIKKAKTDKRSFKDILRSVAEWFRAIPGRTVAFIMPNGKLSPKRLTIFICSVLLALLLLAGAVVGGVLLFQPDASPFDPDTVITPDDDGFPKENMYGVGDASSLNELLKNWATNGMENAHSSNVVNVLLIGVDSRTEGGAGRSDAMILVSLNKATQKITLASFSRDSYTYMNIGGGDRFDKVNHSFIWGGPEVLIPTLENDYKIQIDHWAYVDFVTFARVVDILGGVNITVTAAEAQEVNSHPRVYNYSGANLPSGENVLLNGKQALAFSRIRHIDSDNARTERQRKMITQLLQKAKSATVEQIAKMAVELLKNVKTDLGLTSVTNLGIEALNQGWVKFAVGSLEVPEDKELRRGAYLKGTYAYPNLSIALAIIDYPRAAQALQMRLYGQTNIVIDENTPSALELLTPPPVPSTKPYVPPVPTVSVNPPVTSTAPPTTPPPATSTAPPTAPPPVTSTAPPATPSPVTSTAPPATPPPEPEPPTEPPTPPTDPPTTPVNNTGPEQSVPA